MLVTKNYTWGKLYATAERSLLRCDVPFAKKESVRKSARIATKGPVATTVVRVSTQTVPTFGTYPAANGIPKETTHPVANIILGVPIASMVFVTKSVPAVDNGPVVTNVVRVQTVFIPPCGLITVVSNILGRNIRHTTKYQWMTMINGL
jgi:hypothetical protein